MTAQICRPTACALSVFVLMGLCACSSPPPLVAGPTSVQQSQPVHYVERVNTGSIYQANSSSAWLFTDQRKPRNIGDTLKIDIAESLNASQSLSTDTSRDNKVASKGPGAGDAALGGVLTGLLNMDVSASSSDAYKGSGKSENAQALKGKIAASVINVLPNGNLVVAGERSIAMNGGVSTLRFSGVVNPADIKPGGIVASGDVVDARIEQVGGGDLADSASRGWLQRLLTKSLTVW
jgi:flagellar L-ring protein precursor FlgH